MTRRKKQAKALRGTAGIGTLVSEEGFTEITSGKSRGQLGLVTPCTDSSNEATNRRRGEPRGIDTCARRSLDRGVMSSQEMVHVSLMEVTPTSGKGALGTWWSP